jgi:hypothetical protein
MAHDLHSTTGVADNPTRPRMTGALVYGPGWLPTLHTMRDEAVSDGNQRLANAVSLLIVEYIARRTNDNGDTRLRKQAIRFYRESVKC